MRHIVTVALILVGMIHLPPLFGMLGSDQLTSLYGVSIDDPSLLLLMRHRAVLFGILGVFFIMASRVEGLQMGALVAGFASVGSFLVLTWTSDAYNTSIGNVALVDLVALALLVLGLITKLYLRRER